MHNEHTVAGHALDGHGGRVGSLWGRDIEVPEESGAPELTNRKSSDAPWWMRFAEKFGLPAVIAAFLIYWITSGLTETVKNTEVMLMQHNQLTAYYLRAICINTAVDESRRANCMGIQEER